MITELIEAERGCGYRVPGGLYLVGAQTSGPCYRFPIELSICPHCGQGIKFSRSFTWLSAALVQNLNQCKEGSCKNCDAFFNWEEEYGLMWVGEKFYPTPSDFIKESMKQGISKRIPFVPKDLVIGKSWVLLAHRKAIVSFTDRNEPKNKPGIFAAFKPTDIQYVVTGDEPDSELAKLEKRGISLVRVIRQADLQMEITGPLL